MLQTILDAEGEWLENAPETYGHDAGEVWAEDIFPRVLSGKLQAVDIEDMMRYLPKFLERIGIHTSARSTIGEFRELLQPFKFED